MDKYLIDDELLKRMIKESGFWSDQLNLLPQLQAILDAGPIDMSVEVRDKVFGLCTNHDYLESANYSGFCDAWRYLRDKMEGKK